MARIKNDRFLMSEKFFSIQCEGKTTGYPAYFLRLTNCNLVCGCSPSYVNQMKKGEIEHDPGSFVGDLQLAGNATWVCDTIPVWIKGAEIQFQQIINDWKTEGVYDDITKGLIHLIWTGGEPTIQQESIVNFEKYWQLEANKTNNGTNRVFHEIETNGTLYIDDELFNLLDQINCSPKLANSGQLKQMRIVPKAIQRIMEHPNYQFKFVISTEDDVFEMFDTYINEFKIPLQNVCCMPGLDSQDQFHERTRFILEMAKKYKFIGLTRLHVSAWNKTTGV